MDDDVTSNDKTFNFTAMNVNRFYKQLSKLGRTPLRTKILPAANSGFKKSAVQWLNQTLHFVLSSVVANSFVLRNRQLIVAAKR